jgi:hypothetical protein
MSRDYSLFPDDENGDVLWGMASRGDKLDIPREINFSVVFPSEDEAMEFAVHLLRNDQKVSFSSYDGKDGFPWQVEVHPMMPALHETISDYENLLAADAKPLGGMNDGWGCFAQE